MRTRISLTAGRGIVLGLMFFVATSNGLHAQGVETPVRISQTLLRARILKIVKPVYPSEAKQKGITGIVRIDVLIGKNGEVKRGTLVSGRPELASAALEAVRQWVYEPYRLNGKAVEVESTVIVNFKLKVEKSPPEKPNTNFNSTPGPLKISDGLELVKSEKPRYPSDMRASGQVVLRLVIGKDC